MVLALFSLFQLGPRLYQKTSSINGSPVESGPIAFEGIPLWIVHAFVDWFGLCFIVLSVVLAWFSLFRQGPRLYQKGPSLPCFCISRCLLFHSFVYGTGFFFMVLFMASACFSFSCLWCCLGFVIVLSIVWHVFTVLSMMFPWCSSLFCLWCWLCFSVVYLLA